VKFSNEQDIFRSVYHAVNNALLSHSQIRLAQPDSSLKNPYKIEDTKSIKVDYLQQSFNYGKITEHFNKPMVMEAQAKDIECIKSEYESHREEIIAVQESVKPAVPFISEAPADINTAGLRSKPLLEARIIGQVFSTYILLQQDNDLLLLDQHAAHERIMYEELKKMYDGSILLSQMLLAAVVVQLTHQEIKFLEEEVELFNKLGFIYENFGNNSIILRSVPYNEQGGNVREIFLEILDFVINKARIDRTLIADEALYKIACKAAIKANMKMDILEIVKLIERLSEVENPFTCPHGRPSIIKLTKHELEKMFKRIV
jgi:DNA mismatch repair protein MutL